MLLTRRRRLSPTTKLARTYQRADGDRDPPAERTGAIDESTSPLVAVDGSPLHACSTPCAAIARAVGCSNISVGDKASPVSARSRDDSSVAASESTPASISGVPELISDAGAPVSSRTTRSTATSA